MEKIKFAMLGGGKRSEYYIRVAKALPEVFEHKGSWLRDPEKAKNYSDRLGVQTFTDLDEVLNLDVDFFVLALSWHGNFEYSQKLIELGKNFFIETPAAPGIEQLQKLWELKQDKDITIGVADEYHRQPYHESCINLVEQGIIGNPHYLYISMMHGYHFANIARKLMGTKMESFTVRGEQFDHKIAATADLKHEFPEKPLVDITHQLCRIQFESGKTVVYDFSGELYASLIRSTDMCLWGEKGEIRGTTVRFINEDGDCTREELTRYDLGHYSNLQQYTHKGFSFCGKWIYKNPFNPSPLIDDEIAVAGQLVDMKKYIETGDSPYTFEDALQDAYMSFLMTQSCKTGEELKSEPQPWQK